MFSKLLLSLSPILSAAAPACATSLPLDIKVFATMMEQNLYRSGTEAEAPDSNPESIRFDETIRAMSFNILSDDNKEHPWIERKGRVASMIRFHQADLIGLQEPSLSQIDDLAKILPEYEIVPGIASGKEGQFYDPILFRKSRFVLISTGTFYLSETPEAASLGWDAKLVRSATWVQLNDKKSGKPFYFFNTHLDYYGRLARDESARLLKKKIQEIAGEAPVVLTGDFNLFPQIGGAETYQILTERSSPGRLVDAQTSTLFPHHGPTGTWSGFKEAGQPGIKPDYIFVTPQIEVYLHGILGDTFDGQFPSDHLPVIADLKLP